MASSSMLTTGVSYKFIKLFGSGSLGTVSLFRRKDTGEECACKKITLPDDHVREVTFKEIQLMKTLNSELIVNLFDSWVDDDDNIHMLMESCDDNLAHFIEVVKPKQFQREPGSPLSTSEYSASLTLVSELAQALDYLHEKTIIHRDVKPSNVLINYKPGPHHIKLCDFNMSKIHLMSSHTQRVGTLKFMAPEVFHSRTYNLSADIYGLAMIALELTGFSLPLPSDLAKAIEPSDWQTWLDTTQVQLQQDNDDNDEVNVNLRCLLTYFGKCLTVLAKQYKQRPDSKSVLNAIIDFTIETNGSDITDIDRLMTNIQNQSNRSAKILQRLQGPKGKF